MRTRIFLKTITFALPAVLLLAFSESCWGVVVVCVRNLSYHPTPPNPVKIIGRVTSASPVRLSDGSGEITVIGLTASVGDFLVVTGNWDGSVLSASGPTEGFIGPARTHMVYIPTGSFLMGNSGIGDDATYGYSDEFPQHSVNLSGYWIGKYEVTRGEYRAFVNAGGYSNQAYWSTDGWSWKVSAGRTQPDYWAAAQNWGSGAFTQTDRYPVVGVSYYEAEAFCNWAGGHLPTEAQWEKAARWNAATNHPNVYPWGDVSDQEKCNNFYDHNPAGGGYEAYQTSPVDSYPSGASPYGIMDMAGNDWQWCQDWYRSYPGSSPFDYTNSYRVLRGCGWDSDYDGENRCASRSILEPYATGPYFGFRLAR